MARVSLSQTLLGIAVCVGAIFMAPIPAFGQGGPPARVHIGVGPPPGTGSTAGRPAQPGYQPRGFWPMGWGWGWGWQEPPRRPAPDPDPPPPPFRPWVENKDFAAPKLDPVTREFPEGSLKPPRAEHRDEFEGPCTLHLNDGKKVDSQRCRKRPDTVTYVDDVGRNVWLSADMVDWRASTFSRR